MIIAGSVIVMVMRHRPSLRAVLLPCAVGGFRGGLLLAFLRPAILRDGFCHALLE
jgi:hypothetical protein